jgi:phage-related protein
MARAQAQYLRIYDEATTYQRWQSYYANATITWDGQPWQYVPFIADGFTEGVSGDESSINVKAPAIITVVQAFDAAILAGRLVELSTYQFDPLFGNDSPQSIQTLIGRYVGQVAGGAAGLTTMTLQLGSAISPVGAQIPPRTFTTAIMGKGARL